MFANYSYYTEQYHGRMDAVDFTRLIGKASAYVNALTFGRAKRLIAVTPTPLKGAPFLEPDRVRAVRDAACAVADALLFNEQGGGVVSETVGKISVNYAAGVSNTGNEQTRLREAAMLYLSGTHLTYRGAYHAME